MTLAKFLESLFSDGHVRVPAPAEIATGEAEAALSVLTESEAVRRLELPADVPKFDPESAMWAAELVYRGAQFLVYRDVDPEFVKAAFSVPVPDAESPQTHYSVDLCFQYLGDLFRLAKHASSDDPLNDEILRTLQNWPLSAVGVVDCDAATWHRAFEHTGLRRMYVDRVIAKSAQKAMAEPRIQADVVAAAGAFPALVPNFKTTSITADKEDNEV